MRAKQSNQVRLFGKEGVIQITQTNEGENIILFVEFQKGKNSYFDRLGELTQYDIKERETKKFKPETLEQIQNQAKDIAKGNKELNIYYIKQQTPEQMKKQKHDEDITKLKLTGITEFCK